MGTVLGLVNDSDSTNPAKPVTPVRYLYTPYGEAHAEVAPEVLGVKFVTKINDVPVTSITDLSGTTRTQTVADATVAATGMLRVVLSLPAESATLGAALSVETSTTKDVWSPVAASSYAIGQKADRPEEVDVLPLAGWQRGASYRVKLAPSLTDKVGRALGSEASFEWSVPGGGDVAFETSFPVNYETYLAAGESAGGAFVGGQPMGFQGSYSDNLTGLQYKRHRFYDPRTLQFLSEDSAGDRDSPNLYAYVGWKPHRKVDPRGLYEEDVHHYLTRYLARVVGFDEATAESIGKDTGMLDYDDRDAMYQGRAMENWPLYHFVTATRLESMRISATGPNLNTHVVGEYLHALEDSFSHQSNDLTRDFSKTYDQKAAGYHVGHGLEGHKPDQTWRHVALALKMARAVYDALKDIYRNTHGNEDSPQLKSFTEVRNDIVKFLSFTPDLYPQTYYGVKTVDNVRDYSEKIRLLDNSFVPTPYEGERRAKDYQEYLDEKQRQEDQEKQNKENRQYYP